MYDERHSDVFVNVRLFKNKAKNRANMKGLNAAKEILKEFEISSQNVIQPLPPIEKNVKSDDIHQYWPISSKNSITQNRVQKRTFEEKIREEIDGIVNTKNNDENQTSPRKLEPLPPFNLHISENISVGPGQVRSSRKS